MPNPPPYENLYVYILQSRLPSEQEAFLGKHFLGNWIEGESSFLFFSRPAEQELKSLMEACPNSSVIGQHCFAYEDWQGGQVEPHEIGPFLIVPFWLASASQDHPMKIVLDPGVVFGNALHPTTRDCLRALALAREGGRPKQVLDLGTGTGILAVASALLGAEDVLAVDNNPLCVKTARANVERNRLQKEVRIVEGDAALHLSDSADWIIANIHGEVIRDLFQKNMNRRGQKWILSGLMRSPFREVKARMEKSRLRILREWDQDMTWHTLLAERG